MALGLVALVYHFRSRIHFDGPTFVQQVRLASPWHVLTALALILSTYWMRSARWATFISPVRRVPLFSLTGSQFIGFTAVSLFGRLADLTRPYLISKRVELSVSSQVAVYTIERMFDLGAAAVLFSFALAITPRTAPHHEIFVRSGVLALAGTAFLAGFALAIRLAGPALARMVRATIGRVSKPLGEGIAEKILGFREGLYVLSSVRDFAAVSALSMLIWTCVAFSYVEAVHAFPHTPELATLPFSRVMLLMGASMGGSLLQLPIIGWFTQVAVTSAAMYTFYGAPIEAATACGGVLLLNNVLCVIPIGIFYSRLERVSLRAATKESSTLESDKA
ncbi:putative dolichol-P-glucose synthetase [Granulicella sibirica]|uniref:Putative dolichol-P-glucose synthetase n=1 Tax=Granulicella sibirica TaxID=2479048 RepID=A0A4Q0SVG9_9BACT|nr:putative dolichol-P-glucose synthetase [Granulicella sibirica]